MNETPTPAISWAGEYRLAAGDCASWQIGPFKLWASMLSSEIRLAFDRGSDPLDSTLVVSASNATSEPPEGSKVRRFGFSQPPGSIELVPCLADRPIVVSPGDPLILPPHEQTTLFISTPLWVMVMAGKGTSPLLDQPTHRVTDTWFGPSTMEGELCYATRTNARMNLENLPVRPHRVISTVEIRNEAKSDLSIEKLRIPAQQMSVYATGAGHFWTESVTLDRKEEGETAAVRLGKGPPQQAPAANPVGGPRTQLPRGVLTRAFAGLLG